MTITFSDIYACKIDSYLKNESLDDRSVNLKDASSNDPNELLLHWLFV